MEEWECLVRQYDAQNLDTLRDTIKAAILAHNPQDSEWCRYVRLSATRLQEYDALKGKGKRKGKGKGKRQRQRERKKQGYVEGRNIRHVEHEMLHLQRKGSSQVPDMAS